jgi:hypothetical protein
MEYDIDKDIEKNMEKISWKKKFTKIHEKNKSTNEDRDKIREISASIQTIRVEQQNNCTDMKDFFRQEFFNLKSEIRKEIQNFKIEICENIKNKFDQLNEANHIARGQIETIRQQVQLNPTGNDLLDKISVINENTCASRERLRNLKEDMINLNVKVDNVTEKLIMDRLGLIDKATSGSVETGNEKNRLKKIEDDLDKIKNYSQKSVKILENGHVTHSSTSGSNSKRSRDDGQTGSSHVSHRKRNGSHARGSHIRKSRDRSRSHESRNSSRTSGSDGRTGSKIKYTR